jgi:hypothetical protein
MGYQKSHWYWIFILLPQISQFLWRWGTIKWLIFIILSKFQTDIRYSVPKKVTDFHPSPPNLPVSLKMGYQKKSLIFDIHHSPQISLTKKNMVRDNEPTSRWQRPGTIRWLGPASTNRRLANGFCDAVFLGAQSVSETMNILNSWDVSWFHQQSGFLGV